MRYYSQKPLQTYESVKTVALSTVHYLRIRLVPITAVLLVRTLETCSGTYLHIREHPAQLCSCNNYQTNRRIPEKHRRFKMEHLMG